jgi:hypothetical protein
MHNNRIVQLAGWVEVETERAYLFNTGWRKTFLRKTQCLWHDDSKEMTLPEWLAMERNLVEPQPEPQTEAHEHRCGAGCCPTRGYGVRKTWRGW